MRYSKYWNNNFKYEPHQDLCLDFLARNKKSMVFLGTGSGKTCVALSLFALLLEKNPDYRCLYITEKSSVNQIGSDLNKFFKDITITTVPSTKMSQRVSVYERYNNNPTNILVMTYPNLLSLARKSQAKDKSMVQRERNELLKILGHKKTFLVVDEATSVANNTSLIFNLINNISMKVNRCVGLTATPIMKKLDDVYNIMACLDLPVMIRNAFVRNHCKFRVMNIRGRRIQTLVGYNKVTEFWESVKDLYFSHKVEIPVGVHPIIYNIDLNQHSLLSLRTLTQHTDNQPPFNLVEIIMNSPSTLDKWLVKNNIDVPLGLEKAVSEKFLWLERMLYKLDSKVVIYSTFTTILNDFIYRLELKPDQYATITGETKDRDAEKYRFINSEKCQYMFMTDAGSKGVDGLQVAQHMIFLNLPISSGTYTQLIGRLRRIGSKHLNAIVHLPITRDSVEYDVYYMLQNELYLVNKLNPDQILDVNILDKNLSFSQTIYEESRDVERWLKAKIKNREYNSVDDA